MNIPFTKMHGLGNDFIVIDATQQSYSLTTTLIQQMSNRHIGIGFDQLLVVRKPSQPHVDFDFQIFNADGSEVGQCGNGARCIARFVYDHQLTQKKHIILQTITSQIEAHLGEDTSVSVNMGIPRFEPEQIPFVTNYKSQLYHLAVNDQEIEFNALNVGNPHIVLCVGDVTTAPLESLGAYLEQHTAFPERVNVGFMEIINRQRIKLRVYERGTGETLACGSGACAAAVAGQVNGWLDKQVTVTLPGGELSIQWEGYNKPVWMTGPAIAVFTGTWI